MTNITRKNLGLCMDKSTEDIKGFVFDIQAFSVHDGPGCRTLFFLSGCPMGCTWCANPEGWQKRKRVLYAEQKCKHIKEGCNRCQEFCPYGAISFDKDNLLILDRKLCESCTTFECAEGCKNNAIRISGREITLKEFADIIQRDRQFWNGGGVTFTGGEPMTQKDFLLEALKYCKKNYVHTAIETCSYVPSQTFRTFLPYLNFIFMDLKNMDDQKHIKFTGVSHKQILENIKIAAGPEYKGRLVIRIPIIPGFNDDKENLIKTAEFMNSVGLQEVNLLPFHRMGNSKWEQLGQQYPFHYLESVDPEDLYRFKPFFESKKINCYIGSNTPF